MNFDINEVLSDMLSAITGTVKDNLDDVKSIGNNFLQRNKETLEMMAQLRISGDLNEEKFASRLNDQKLVLEAELNATAVKSKAIAQQAANAAIDVLEKAVKIAISTAI